MKYMFSILMSLMVCAQLSVAQTKATYVAPTTQMRYDVWKTTETFPSDEFNEKRFALVVAVSSYASGNHLPNNRNDAVDMTSALNKAGFDVMVVSDPNKKEFLTAIADARSYYLNNEYNVVLVYFSGHGAQMGNMNLLIPSDAVFTRDSEDEEIFEQYSDKSVLLSEVIGQFDLPQTQHAICMVDACRSYTYILTPKSNQMAFDARLQTKLNIDNEKVEMRGNNTLFLPSVSGRTTPAVGPNARNSFFTYYLLHALAQRPSTLSQFASIVTEKLENDGHTQPIISLGTHSVRFRLFHDGPKRSLSDLLKDIKDGFYGGIEDDMLYYANQGDVRAQYQLANMYYEGHIGQSDVEAVKWYHKAAVQGYADAQVNLGYMYLVGQGVQQIDSEAVKWFRAAANQGDSNGQYNLGSMYENGIGVTRDELEAIKWYVKSANQGNPEAQCQLGFTYDRTDRKTEALKWFRMAAEQEHEEAQFFVGLYYENGLGVQKNCTEAVRWYRMAADQANPDAQLGLGRMYFLGCGVSQSDSDAFRWYQKAAEQDFEPGQFNVGWMYEHGRGVSQSNTYALYWYQLAAQQGNVHALEAVARLSNK